MKEIGQSLKTKAINRLQDAPKDVLTGDQGILALMVAEIVKFMNLLIGGHCQQ